MGVGGRDKNLPFQIQHQVYGYLLHAGRYTDIALEFSFTVLYWICTFGRFIKKKECY